MKLVATGNRDGKVEVKCHSCKTINLITFKGDNDG